MREDGSAGPVTLRDLVAGNLRRLRTEAGVPVEDLLPTARANGMDWTASWVSAVERGTRCLTAEQLLALPVVLSEALRRRVTLADLLHGDAPVALVSHVDRPLASVPAGYLRDVVTGASVPRPFSTAVSAPAADPAAGAAGRAAHRLREISRCGLGDVDIRALARAEAGAGTAEARLARRLDVPEIAVVAAAASLWDHSLTEELTVRAQAGELPNAAGRRLAADLTSRIYQAANRAAEARLAAMQSETDVRQPHPAEHAPDPAGHTPPQPAGHTPPQPAGHTPQPAGHTPQPAGHAPQAAEVRPRHAAPPSTEPEATAAVPSVSPVGPADTGHEERTRPAPV